MSPDIEKYKTALFEAQRFIERTEKAIDNFDHYGNKHTAATKMSSMGLTRALTEMRR